MLQIFLLLTASSNNFNALRLGYSPGIYVHHEGKPNSKRSRFLSISRSLRLGRRQNCIWRWRLVQTTRDVLTQTYTIYADEFVSSTARAGREIAHSFRFWLLLWTLGPGCRNLA